MRLWQPPAQLPWGSTAQDAEQLIELGERQLL